MLAALLISLTGMVYPIITRKMLNDFIPNQKYNLIVGFGICLLVIYLIRYGLRFFVQYYGHCMGAYMQADMRRDLFKKLQALPFSFYDENETGRIMTRMTSDLFDVSELAHHGPENIIMSTLMVVLSFIYLSTINLKLSLIIFACVPFLVGISLKLRNVRAIASEKSRKYVTEINNDTQSSVSGIRVTKAFANDNKELEKFEKNNIRFVRARKDHYKYFALYHSTSMFIMDIFNVVVLLAGGIYLFNGEISFGDYSAFVVSISMFLNPINTLIGFSEQLQEGTIGFKRFLEIMDQPIEADKKDVREYKHLNGDIEFKHVSFAYSTDNKTKEVLNDVSFKVEKGKTVALVGPSGGGKTTICHLLPRFYNIEQGEIKIDSKNIQDISMKSLRENIGIVQQDVFLFSGSFYDNILYGKLDASKKEVIAAAKKANIYDYIMSLPNGFDTEIGERGIRLSGGQKQRLSIARVFLKNPSLLILDEATSALDNTTEVLIQEALNSLKKGRTTIVVAHRLSTIKNADKILVVSNGKIIEEGTHAKLINKRGGIYKKLYNSQFKDKDFNINTKIMMS